MRESSLSAGSVSTPMSSHWSKSSLNTDRFLKSWW
uniref:Putative cold inducible RNA binding protein variant 1 n=1 Tax=Taeniopygia guttata TaxID=59729 RepID=B5G1G1_TAEGU|nr:putative cold inducible RNA binding protein variant 1 [Taeniopygia guttata]